MSYFLENEEAVKEQEILQDETSVQQENEQDGIASIEPLLDNRIVRAIREMGFEKLSPIQEQAIPYLLQGEDITDRHRPVPARPQHSVSLPFSISIRT